MLINVKEEIICSMAVIHFSFDLAIHCKYGAKYHHSIKKLK